MTNSRLQARDETCAPAPGGNLWSATGLSGAGCMAMVLSQPAAVCSHRFFIWAPGVSCGCVAPDVDCGDPQSRSASPRGTAVVEIGASAAGASPSSCATTLIVVVFSAPSRKGFPICRAFPCHSASAPRTCDGVRCVLTTQYADRMLVGADPTVTVRA